MLLYFFNVRQMMHNLVWWLQSRYTETSILSFREIIMLLLMLCGYYYVSFVLHFFYDSMVLKNPRHFNFTTILMCSIETTLLNSGWTGTGWVGIHFLISKDNKPASWELSLYWEVCSAYDFPRKFLLFSICAVIRLQLSIKAFNFKD